METTKPSSRRAAKAAAGAETEFYSPDDYRSDDSVAYLMRRLITVFASEVQQELDPRGLTNAQWVPMYKLHLGHGSTAAELARECQLDAGAMTRTLDRLEAKGLLRRVRSSQDRRVVNLELTDQGREASGHIPQALCKVLNAHLRGFSHDEVELLRSMLQRMLDNGIGCQKDRENT
ncbi:MULTISPECIES: MarR family winged helix-turn-helix transcriptional regulator [Ramlibacter]|uniref:MarR family transcriptional regulator n=1 Tax=Ramlibacter pinisoli TaxID=2682844 RepID=A0A6N8INW7_9BURK|nr:MULTISPECIES: MarR family transcriptional regulator [Ramlibacter]MBA2963582.1 MarR family transcriptional regulator [Ramlibacter sp. CGMCC 1.13660]MVQ28547.1 MarR family transcriptional regulator [Ramlibacter pinisoli]